MKKLLSFIGVYFLLVIAIYFGNFSIVSSIEDKVSDLFMQERIDLNPYKSDNVLIVAIDEKSIKSLGQWPWSRNKMAQIINNLNTAGVGIIGLDITFGEEDGKSPSVVLAGDERFTNLDYDDLLAKAFLNSPTVEGLMMYFGDPTAPSYYNYEFTPVTAFTKTDISLLLNAQGIISNIPILQESGYSSGFLNTIPDADGVIRYAPLVIANENNIYPSLSLEIARLVFDAKGIHIDADNGVVDGIKLNDIYIPTDIIGRFHINFKGGVSSYEYISAYDIYTNNFDKEKINSKIVLIGATAVGLSDNKATPMGIIVPGVQIHANMIDNILLQDYIYINNSIFLEVFILFILIALIASMSLIKRTAIGLSISVLIIITYILIAYFYFIETNMLIFVVFPAIVGIMTLVISFSYRLLLEQKEKNKISNLFSKKVSKEVMDSLMNNQSSMMIAHQKEASIFFSDIRGFTSMSEKLTPIQVVNLLNDYLTPMVDIIDKNFGTVDKFIGDAIMAYWNAPLDLEHHADYALTSAIEQMKYLHTIQGDIKEKYGVDLDIGIGINTGDVTVGEIGSIGRSDYTVIGDAVNLASRVESLNKRYKTSIIITEYTKDRLTGEYDIEFLDSVVVKGKSKAVNIYKVLVY